MKSPSPLTKNHAAKWITGIAAAGATGTTSGALVQIDLINNNITAGGGNQLNADFTGDAINDIVFNNTGFGANPTSSLYAGGVFLSTTTTTNPNLNRFARATTIGTIYSIDLGGSFQGTSTSSATAPAGSRSGYLPITFNAASLGGSTNENGFLFVTAGGFELTRGVTLNALIFDDAVGGDAPLIGDVQVQAGSIQVIGSTTGGTFVPEPSGLTLLALGAAGVVTRRRRIL